MDAFTRENVETLSAYLNEPDWMLEFRLKALEAFHSKPMPKWGVDLSKLIFEDIIYYSKPVDRQTRTYSNGQIFADRLDME